MKLISCRVLESELTKSLEKLGVRAVTEYLEAGLHDNPKRLKSELQQAIDRTDEEVRTGREDYEAIVIGYGLCGGGSLGLQAGSLPLVIPRVHDCISLFLGSHEAYQEQFSRYPGTFYMTKDWFEHKTQPLSTRKSGRSLADRSEEGQNWNLAETYQSLKEKYGKDNADNVYAFLNTWKKNYSRSVFIDNGEGEDSPSGEYARALAEGLSWTYQRLEGSPRFFDQMVSALGSNREILVVPPGHKIAWDPLTKGICHHHPEEKQDLWQRPLPQAAEALTGFRDRREGLGLGIDAGGTYTDAVVYDFSRRKVILKAKARTTKWDFTQGITAALEKLDPALLRQVDITVVSTTLATNAIVEGTGRKVGLLLMPLGGVEPQRMLSHPWKVVEGDMSIDGRQTRPVNSREILRTCREMIEQDGVEAFAVSGYGSTINPENEREIKGIIEKETRKGVCCGHELSSSLNFYLRANTAVLNAGIIPLLEQFITDLDSSVRSRGIKGRMMIVKGDGSLMSCAQALRRPVETALSGPAASVAGASFMTENEDAMIIDVGGTTSDIGILKGGKIGLTEEGARVGRWRTHIKAVDMSTLGIGGDSRILIRGRELTVGPKRIEPLCHLQEKGGWEEAAEFLPDLRSDYFSSTEPMEILALSGKEADFALNPREREILSLLEERPYSVKELAEEICEGVWRLVATDRLEQNAVVQRFGLTPTDVLVARKEISLWDSALPGQVTALYRTIWGEGEAPFDDALFAVITQNLLKTLVLKELDLSGEEARAFGQSPVFRSLMTNLTGGVQSLRFTPGLNTGLIGVGAAAPFILSGLSALLEAPLLIPEDGDVANAVGAVSSLVRVNRSAQVVPDADGSFLVTGLSAGERFDSYDLACEFLERQLADEIQEEALQAGTEERTIRWAAENRLGTSSSGERIFLGRVYEAEIVGLPL